MTNPLYEAWQETYKNTKLHNGFWYPSPLSDGVDILHRMQTMKRMQLTYAWAIPSPEAIEYLAKLGPIVEIGAGRGYWASLIQAAGGDVICYDCAPPGQIRNRWTPNSGEEDSDWRVSPLEIQKDTFTEILIGGPEKVLDHQDRTLLLCWPTPHTPMAYDCLRHYKGDCLVFVGEYQGGCTATDQFFELVEAEWEETHQIDIPFWDCLHDRLWVYKRRAG